MARYQTDRGSGARSQAGLTMIELLLAIAIMGLVSAMLVGGWINLQRSSSFALASNDARGDGRDALTTGLLPESFPTWSPFWEGIGSGPAT